jgi:hypothetical protein
MADVYVLNGANGSSINIASYVVDPGPDFGETDLQKVIYSENPMAEGGVLAAEYTNVRRMQFPLRLASAAAFSGVNGLVGWLRQLARPGATFDIQLDGVASTDGIRFDVNDGRFELDPAWDTRLYSQTDRLEGTLKLDVQPFGYWPTWIILGSAASVGLPGFLAIDNSKFVGDVPAQARLTIAPTSGTTYGFGSWYIDTLSWSIHGQGASFKALWSAASITQVLTASLTADPFAISSQALETLGRGSWNLVAAVAFPGSLAPAYYGRFRVWALAKSFPSQLPPWYVTADAAPGGDLPNVAVGPLASAAPIATLYPAIASGGGSGGDWSSASPGYNLLNLGEMTFPPAQSASGRAAPFGIRLWTSCATSSLPVATPYIRFDSLWLQPLPNAGVLTRNLQYRSDQALTVWGGGDIPQFFLDSEAARILTIHPDASQTPIREALGDYRGAVPYIGASNLSVEVAGFGKRFTSPTTTIAREAPAYAAVSLQQRPRFLFMKGI